MPQLTDIESSTLRYNTNEVREASIICREYFEECNKNVDAYAKARSAAEAGAAPIIGLIGVDETLDAQIAAIKVETERWDREGGPCTPYEQTKRMLICTHYISLIHRKYNEAPEHVLAEYRRQWHEHVVPVYSCAPPNRTQATLPIVAFLCSPQTTEQIADSHVLPNEVNSDDFDEEDRGSLLSRRALVQRAEIWVRVQAIGLAHMGGVPSGMGSTRKYSGSTES